VDAQPSLRAPGREHCARDVGGDGTEFGSPFVLGQFTVLSSTTNPPPDLTLADMQSYTQGFNFGVGTYTQKQWILAGYAQDSYRARNDLTLDLGLRYDRQTFSDATSNVAPRVGFAWNPKGDPKTAVRGGYGIYWTQLRSNLAASFELNGPLGIGSYSANPGQTGFPACLTCTPVLFDPNAAASTLPARNVTIRPGQADVYTPMFAQFGVDFSKVASDRANNDRPVIDGVVVGKSAFRGTNISDVALFAEQRLRVAGRSILLRVEGFNVFNHANIFARNGTYGTPWTRCRHSVRRRRGWPPWNRREWCSSRCDISSEGAIATRPQSGKIRAASV
jgi:hypothetical protein